MAAVVLAALVGVAAPVRADDDGFAGEPAPAPATDSDAPSAEDEYEAGWRRTHYHRVKIPRTERPLTIPKRTFDVYVTASVRTPSPTAESFLRVPLAQRDGPPRLTLFYGMVYGITADWQASLSFPPLIFVDGVQFAGPVGEMTWRVLATESVELGLSFNAIIPIDNDLGGGGRIPLRLRLAPTLHLDVAPEVSVVAGDGRVYANGALPVGLTVQVAQPLALTVTTGVSTLGFDSAALFASAEAAFTLADDHGAVADLVLGFGFPTLIDGSGRGTFVETGHWALTVGARFFVNLPPDRMGAP